MSLPSSPTLISTFLPRFFYLGLEVDRYAVNVGGFGFMLGSLANLIALRLARDSKAWLMFHAYSLPFLFVTGGIVYLRLFVART